MFTGFLPGRQAQFYGISYYFLYGISLPLPLPFLYLYMNQSIC